MKRVKSGSLRVPAFVSSPSRSKRYVDPAIKSAKKISFGSDELPKLSGVCTVGRVSVPLLVTPVPFNSLIIDPPTSSLCVVLKLLGISGASVTNTNA